MDEASTVARHGDHASPATRLRWLLVLVVGVALHVPLPAAAAGVAPSGPAPAAPHVAQIDHAASPASAGRVGARSSSTHTVHHDAVPGVGPERTSHDPLAWLDRVGNAPVAAVWDGSPPAANDRAPPA